MNCKPGDLAVIVRDDIPENIGRIVTVVGPTELDGSEGPGFWWDVVAEGQLPLAFNYHDSVPGRIEGYAMDVEHLDSDLLPISGAPMTDDMSDEVTA
ncbi:hypothetical protein [Burkholderia cenocepacia]|uniref:hypothetical protein n=1 Tax=Burkholderia cenocepacia TaxID=95486 RepID=UPI001588ADB0|nr:hypothetical protein [Burkholderia cenocepacia]